jgi:sugar phosphate isomerase/epimerase
MNAKSIKIGVADYGLWVWDGGCYDLESRLLELKQLGYQGIEMLAANSASDAIRQAALFRKLGMDFSTCHAPSHQLAIEWVAALGKNYVWLTPGAADRGVDCEVYYRRSNALVKACRRWNITAAIHNHMGCRVQSQEELEDFLRACPEAGLILDTGHLSMAGGDAVEIVRKYHKRIAVMHVKDVFLTGRKDEFGADEYRFCELGAGNNGFNNATVIEELLRVGWEGWVHVEHDAHLRDPLVDLAVSWNFIQDILKR